MLAGLLRRGADAGRAVLHGPASLLGLCRLVGSSGPPAWHLCLMNARRSGRRSEPANTGTKGFAADRRYWQTVVPICRFNGRELAGLELLPGELGCGQAMHARGTP